VENELHFNTFFNQMTKRASKENAKDRKCSEDMDDGSKPPPNKRKRDETILWIKDDTLPSDSAESAEIKNDSQPDEEEEEYETDEPDFIEYLMDKYVTKNAKGNNKNTYNTRSQSKKVYEKIPIELTKKEKDYYMRQPVDRRKELLNLMEKMSSLSITEGDVPHKFKILELPISDYIKSIVIKKISAVDEMGPEAGESYKLRTWIDAFLRIPFGKAIPLPVSIDDGRKKCTEFMIDARKIMDKSIYGMVPAKTQILQILAQLIVNPNSVGNVIALQGPMGVGKTSLARNAIAQVMKRPFEFFSLGGASDISNFVGHSYTYEGSMWGRIADSIMHAGAMNPVMYFDELDKVSGTPHGEEVINMMIHLTDRSQNTQFHDRYFSGVDFDLSQCLFVFSFNDIDKVHPILRDRMTVIHCGGYNETDKKVILQEYIWPQLLDRLKFHPSEITLTDEAIKHLISEYSGDEKGVRTLIRTVESMMTRLNILRIVDDESMKQNVFYVEYTNPFVITEFVMRKLLTDLNKKDPEHWRAMYN
jgi:ATP-dependent Lon protease